MNQGTKTRKPRRLKSEGQTSYYQRRKPSLLTQFAFGTWTIMANIIEAVAVLAALLAVALVCFLVPLVIWF